MSIKLKWQHKKYSKTEVYTTLKIKTKRTPPQCTYKILSPLLITHLCYKNAQSYIMKEISIELKL